MQSKAGSKEEEKEIGKRNQNRILGDRETRIQKARGKAKEKRRIETEKAARVLTELLLSSLGASA